MKSMVAKTQDGGAYRTLDAVQKVKAVLETLRGQRSVVEIARHWQVDPANLLKWQCSLVERASSLFAVDEAPSFTKLTQAQMANEAMIAILFEHIDAREALREKEEKLHRLFAYQDQLKEEERKRIAMEIHDELGQNLLAIRLDISSLQDRAGAHQKLHQRISLVLANVDGAIQSVRSMISDLRPFELDLGLPAALQWQVNRFRRMTGIEAQFHTVGCDDEGAEMDDRVTLALFRTLQEAMNHLVRYASPSRVQVLLRCDAAWLELIVDGNGTVVGEEASITPTGLSLESMTERLALIGGTLRLDQLPSGGTRMSCSVPVWPASQAET